MSDSLKTLLEGIQTKWAEEVNLMSLNGPDLHEQPPGQFTIFPYYVIVPEPSVLWGTTSTSRVWNHVLDLRAYDRTPELAVAAIEIVQEVFDADDFTLALDDGHQFVMARRENVRLANAGKEIELAACRYRFQTSQPRF